MLKELIPGDGVFDARSVLQAHPSIRRDESLVMDILLEDFCRRDEAGEPLDAREFCGRFPEYRDAIDGLLQVFGYVNRRAAAVESGDGVLWPAVGQDFLGFRLLRELGHGSFARVYLASEARLGGRRVALKVSPDSCEEAYTLGPLEHPNIIGVHSVHTDAGSKLAAACMPFRGSATLADVRDYVMQHGPPPDAVPIAAFLVDHENRWSDSHETLNPGHLFASRTYVDAVSEVFAQIADALAFIHERSVCHQDLKPANVLLTQTGQPVLLDFNLSANAASSVRGGTVPYMAPEQLRVVAAGLSAPKPAPAPRSDVYALAAMLYELLAARHPFGPLPEVDAGELAPCLLDRQQRAVPSIRRFNPRVDQRLARLIEEGLHPCLERRPAAADFAARLRANLRWPRRFVRWLNAHPIHVAAASAAACVLVCATVAIMATRAPFTARMMANGRTAFANGDWEEAAKCFCQVIDAADGPAEAYRWRARTYQQQGEFDSAIADYRRGGAADCLADLAFCLAKANYHPQAVMRSNELIAQGGHPSAAFWNNRGMSLLEARTMSSAARLPLALKALGEAIRLNPQLQASYFNRALVGMEILRLRWGAERPAGVGDDASVLLQANRDIQSAFRLGPPSADLHVAAARLRAPLLGQSLIPAGLAIPGRFELVALAGLVEHHAMRDLEQAASLGADAQRFASDVALRPFWANPKLKLLAASPPSNDRSRLQMERLLPP
jgi:serine/threonine protein kinase